MLALSASATDILLALFSAWLAIGLTLAVVMGRRGHNAFQWLVVGAVLGPIALPIAWSAVRDEPGATARSLEQGVPGGGPVDVVVGIDGSPQSSEALRTTLSIVGTDVGRLTLAHVVAFDDSPQGRVEGQRAQELLDGAAAAVGPLEPGKVVLSGRAADALVEYATREGYDLLAIGRRGRGATKALLGSTAARVANGPVPVLIV